MNGSDQRFAWLTPSAPAAIALLRCPALPRLLDRDLPAPGRARFACLIDPTGKTVDELVAVRLDEQRLELMVHGGPGVRAAVSACLVAHGLDEGTEQDASSAALRWRALAAASSPAAARWLLIHPSETPLFPAAFLHRAPVILITGPANAGKSTLLNAWCGHRRALVSDLPGTTRDLVAAETLVGGWRLRLFDSAGLRPTSDPLEHAGQELVAAARGWADVVLYLRSSENAGPGPQPGDLVVCGKADLCRVVPPAPRWSSRGLPGVTPAALLAELGMLLLARLGLPAG